MSQFAPEFVDDDGVIVGIRSRFSHRMRLQVPVSALPSRTRQADAKGADINFIVARYKKTGELPVSQRAALFSDMDAADFKESMDLFSAAQQSFAQLPAATRAAFANDPGRLLEALDRADDPKVRAYLEDAGVLVPKAPPLDEVEAPAAFTAPQAGRVPRTVKRSPEPPAASGAAVDTEVS